MAFQMAIAGRQHSFLLSLAVNMLPVLQVAPISATLSGSHLSEKADLKEVRSVRHRRHHSQKSPDQCGRGMQASQRKPYLAPAQGRKAGPD